MGEAARELTDEEQARRELLELKIRSLPIVVNARGARKLKKVSRDDPTKVVGEADTSELLVGLLKAEAIQAEVQEGQRSTRALCAECGMPFNRPHSGQLRCHKCGRPPCVHCGRPVALNRAAQRRWAGKPIECAECLSKNVACLLCGNVFKKPQRRSDVCDACRIRCCATVGCTRKPTSAAFSRHSVMSRGQAPWRCASCAQRSRYQNSTP